MTLFTSLVKLFRSSARPAIRRPRARLGLEILEDRAVPANLFWIGPEGGLWSTAANWRDDLGNPDLPGPASILQFGFQGDPNTGSVMDINGLVVDSIHHAEDYTGTTLLLNVHLQVARNFFAGGTIQIIDSVLDSTSSRVSVGNHFYIDAGGGLITDQQGGDTVQLSASTLELRSGAFWNVVGSNPSTTASARFQGTIFQQGALTIIDDGLEVIGSHHVDSTGTIVLVDAPLRYSGPGSLLISNGTITLQSTQPQDPARIIGDVSLQTGGAVVVQFFAQIVGNLNNGSGTVLLGTTIVAASLQVTGNYTQFLGTLDVFAGSVLNVGGTADVNHRLVVNPRSGFTATVFSVLTANAANGDFTEFNLLPPPPPATSWTHAWEGSSGNFAYVLRAV